MPEEFSMSNDNSESAKVTDKSADRMYFILAPRIVMAMCDDPYQFTLWCVIKDIAGEAGECFINTNDLASLAMMSTGQVSKCRQKLIDKGLLTGELRRDPNYPQPVWHLAVPDLWAKNTAWCLNYPKLRERIHHKKSLHHMKALEIAEEPSPGEEGLTPHEEGLTPGETKKILKEEPKKGDIDPEILHSWQRAYTYLKRFFRQDNSLPDLLRRLDRLELVEFNATTRLLVLQTETEHDREWLESRFTSTLERALRGFPGLADVSVQFTA